METSQAILSTISCNLTDHQDKMYKLFNLLVNERRLQDFYDKNGFDRIKFYLNSCYENYKSIISTSGYLTEELFVSQYNWPIACVTDEYLRGVLDKYKPESIGDYSEIYINHHFNKIVYRYGSLSNYHEGNSNNNANVYDKSGITINPEKCDKNSIMWSSRTIDLPDNELCNTILLYTCTKRLPIIYYQGENLYNHVDVYLLEVYAVIFFMYITENNNSTDENPIFELSKNNVSRSPGTYTCARDIIKNKLRVDENGIIDNECLKNYPVKFFTAIDVYHDATMGIKAPENKSFTLDEEINLYTLGVLFYKHIKKHNKNKVYGWSRGIGKDTNRLDIMLCFIGELGAPG
jgi:hypothetical protein